MLELDMDLGGNLIVHLPGSKTSQRRTSVRLDAEPSNAIHQLRMLLNGQRAERDSATYGQVGARSAPTQYELDKVRRHDPRGRPVPPSLEELGL